MKKSELQEIIRTIVKQTINELMSTTSLISGPDDPSSIQPTDPTAVPTSAINPDELTPLQKMQQQRDAEKQRQDQIKQTDLDVKITGKQTDYFNQQLRKNKMDIDAKRKQLAKLKGAQI